VRPQRPPACWSASIGREKAGCDAVVAPGYEPGVVEILAAKRDGRFLIFEADPARRPPEREQRDVLGLRIEQDRPTVSVASSLADDGRLAPEVRADALFGMVTLRYTQSNSVAFVRKGAAISTTTPLAKPSRCTRQSRRRRSEVETRRAPDRAQGTSPAAFERLDGGGLCAGSRRVSLWHQSELWRRHGRA
jgi:AICARFT/IMPCHase bienzyme